MVASTEFIVSSEIHRIFYCKCQGKGHRFGIRKDYKVITHWDNINGQDLILYNEYIDLRSNKPVDQPNNNCPHCGQVMLSNDVWGVLNEEGHCDLRCEYAIGSLCVCSCGGPNHGKGWLE